MSSVRTVVQTSSKKAGAGILPVLQQNGRNGWSRKRILRFSKTVAVSGLSISSYRVICRRRHPVFIWYVFASKNKRFAKGVIVREGILISLIVFKAVIPSFVNSSEICCRKSEGFLFSRSTRVRLNKSPQNSLHKLEKYQVSIISIGFQIPLFREALTSRLKSAQVNGMDQVMNPFCKKQQQFYTLNVLPALYNSAWPCGKESTCSSGGLQNIRMSFSYISTALQLP